MKGACHKRARRYLTPRAIFQTIAVIWSALEDSEQATNREKCSTLLISAIVLPLDTVLTEDTEAICLTD